MRKINKTGRLFSNFKKSGGVKNLKVWPPGVMMHDLPKQKKERLTRL